MSDQTYTVQLMGQESQKSFAELQSAVKAGQVKGETLIRQGEGNWFSASEVPGLFSDKSYVTAILLSWFLGVFGVDRFYLGYTTLGVIKLLTCGGLGVWALIDLIMIAMRKVPDANGLPLAG